MEKGELPMEPESKVKLHSRTVRWKDDAPHTSAAEMPSDVEQDAFFELDNT